MKYLQQQSMEALFEMIAEYNTLLKTEGKDYESQQKLKMMIGRLEEEVEKRKEKEINSDDDELTP